MRNCWARELGQAEIAAGEDESNEGIREPKSWKICMGVWWDFLRELASKRKEVS